MIISNLAIKIGLDHLIRQSDMTLLKINSGHAHYLAAETCDNGFLEFNMRYVEHPSRAPIRGNDQQCE